MEEAINKANALIEALAYIRSFRGKVVVVKVGGSVIDQMDSLRELLADVAFLAAVGMHPVLVHGGGKAISSACAEAGLEPQFIQGRRYTDARTLAIVEHVLCNNLNTQIVSILEELQTPAMGLHSLSSCVVTGEKLFLQEGDRRIDLGQVGTVKQVNADLLSALCREGHIPVIAPLVRDRSGGKLNVNADSAAGEVASAMKAEKLVMLSDTHGIRTVPEDPESLARSLTERQVREKVDSGVITTGMQPKVEACLAALDAGVAKAHIIDGRIPHALLLEIYTDKGVGTEIVK